MRVRVQRERTRCVHIEPVDKRGRKRRTGWKRNKDGRREREREGGKRGITRSEMEETRRRGRTVGEGGTSEGGEEEEKC